MCHVSYRLVLCCAWPRDERDLDMNFSLCSGVCYTRHLYCCLLFLSIILQLCYLYFLLVHTFISARAEERLQSLYYPYTLNS
jgi:hypothetical protein